MEAMIELGAKAAPSSADVAAETQMVISMLPNDAALLSEAIGGDRDATNQKADSHGIIAALPPGGVHVSCSTVSPYTSRDLARRHRARGSYVQTEAP